MSTNGAQPGQPDAAGARGRLGAALPGDVVGLGSDGTYTIRTVLVGREIIHGRITEWRWLFLDDGSLLEWAPKGCVRYRRHRVFEQGSGFYEELVAQDGALVRFERRVRAGLAGRRQVRVTIDGRPYRVAFTGTADVRRFGAEPDLPPWRSLRPDADQNVYFGLLDPADRQVAILGLWTTDVCLSFGRALDPREITAVHPRQ
jgi:hypothetical protein